MAYVKAEYPCGYKLEMKSYWGASLDYNDKDGCPIHGKNCPEHKKKKNDQL